MDAIGDDTMEKEMKVIEDLLTGSKTPKQEEKPVDKVEMLVQMGFDRAEAVIALQKNGDDLIQASIALTK